MISTYLRCEQRFCQCPQGREDETCDLTVTVVKTTAKAILCDLEDGRRLWLPRSQIRGAIPWVGERGEIEITEWLVSKAALFEVEPWRRQARKSGP